MNGIVRAPREEPDKEREEALFRAALEKQHREYMEERAERRNELVMKLILGGVFLWGLYMTYQILSGTVAL